jgi:MFS family permease
MQHILLNPQFLLVAGVNLCLFLIISAWSFLPLFIVEIGGDKTDVGLVMGSVGITSLGLLPIVAPLIDRYGRKSFMVAGALLAGLSNLGFLLFDMYSPVMILVRLFQGLAFATCFNACSTAVVDLIPAEQRAQGIGLFGISGSLAFAVGPFAAEATILNWGFGAYFVLLSAFGILGFIVGLFVTEPAQTRGIKKVQGFFATAIRDKYLPMMAIAGICGAGFAAMNTFFPLHASHLGLRAGIFFLAYGTSLIVVRLLFGHLADQIRRERIIFGALLGYGTMLALCAVIDATWQTVCLGALFGLLQGLSYPAMMARMVDRAQASNRSVVVALFTGSFGAGINVSLLLWGFIAELKGLPFMYLVGGVAFFACAALAGRSLLKET